MSNGQFSTIADLFSDDFITIIALFCLSCLLFSACSHQCFFIVKSVSYFLIPSIPVTVKTAELLTREFLSKLYGDCLNS